MSPIGGISLPLFKKYLKRSQIENKNFLCIPLCNSVRFQGYVVDVCNKTIVHVDSLQNNNIKKATSKTIATTLFDDDNIKTRTSNLILNKESSLNPTAVVLACCQYCFFCPSLPLPSGLDDAFDIAYSLLEHKAEIPVNLSVPASSN